jgi:hypothetical protein
MGTAILPLQKIQIGEETTKGTIVPAQRILRGQWTVEEGIRFYRSAYPEGFRANVGGAGVILQKGMTFRCSTELNADEILWPLLLGVRGNISPTTSVDEETWVFDPQLNTGLPTLDSASLEWVESDGSTNHIASKAGYAMCRSFGIEWGDVAEARLNYELFARARQVSTPTAALTAYASREIMVSQMVSVFLDTAWAGLGGTLLSGIVRSGRWECTTGIEPNHTTNTRSDRDYTNHKLVGKLRATLSLVMELDAAAAAMINTYYRSNALAFIRIKASGGSNINSNPRSVQVDGAYRFADNGFSMSDDGEIRLVTMSLESVYDTTGGKSLLFTVLNSIGAAEL